ncbi:MAG: hypothetical protein H6555_10690 [Lewinellaceae bacterium]|nr:hypothetical protein [Lewinellaceae bacterium]
MEAELAESRTSNNFAQFDEITRILLEASALKSKNWNNEAKIRFNQLMARYPSHPTLLIASRTFNAQL